MVGGVMTAAGEPGAVSPPTMWARHLRAVGLVLTCALLAVQARLSLQLFGPIDPQSAIWDDVPILSGRHPLHLYHASLSAEAWHRSRALVCFDPTFQAGYPKSPVYDGGGRPAQMAALVAPHD